MKVSQIKKHLQSLSEFTSDYVYATEQLVLLPGIIFTQNLQARYTVKFDHEVDGAIEFKKFKKIVSALSPNDDISFEMDTAEKVHITINGVRTYSIDSFDRNDIPKIKSIKADSYLLMNRNLEQADFDEFKVALQFNGHDELRPSMRGVYVTSEHIVTTDGHCLYRGESKKFLPDLMHYGPEKYDPDFPERVKPYPGFLIPEIGAKQIAKSKETLNCYTYTEEAPVRVDGKKYTHYPLWMQLNGTGYTINFRLIDENYPDYKNVIPDYSVSNHIEVLINKVKLEKLVKLADLSANETTHQTQFRFHDEDKSLLEIFAENPDYGMEFSRNIEIKVQKFQLEKKVAVLESGEEETTPVPMYQLERIGFNARFMQKILKNIDTDEVQFKMQAPNRCFFINDKFLLMPVMLTA